MFSWPLMIVVKAAWDVMKLGADAGLTRNQIRQLGALAGVHSDVFEQVVKETLVPCRCSQDVGQTH
jgi:hypothetical protein